MSRRTLLVGLLATALVVGCSYERKTAVLLTLDLHDANPVDQVRVMVYPEGYVSDIVLQDIPEEAGAPITDNEVKVLILLPDRWADRNLVLSVAGSLDGSFVGQGTGFVLVPKGEVEELQLYLEEGAPSCGNGIREALEQCDGSDIPSTSCETNLGLTHGQVVCTDECLLDVSQCHECGNSAIEYGPEECDSDDFGGRTCSTEGFDGGTLICNQCHIEVANCIGGCGNLVAEPGEVCDGADFGGLTCESAVGVADGSLACTPNCQLDISGCHECGNSSVELGEECDGLNFGGMTCADFDAAWTGHLSCTSGCLIDASTCCGDGVMGVGQDCDGQDFGTQTCNTETGLAEGTLSCTQDCQLDVSGCRECGNGAIEGAEECDGNELGGMTCAGLGYTTGTVFCASDCTFDTSACDDVCGNGVVSPVEGCDDGNLVAGDGCSPTCTVESGWFCLGDPSECGPLTCGNGVIDPNEVCDGADLQGETCLSRGFRPGGGSLTCAQTCTYGDTSTCLGGQIDDEAQLAGAIDDAHQTGTHQRIDIPVAYIEQTGSITIDECGGAPCGAAPLGVTIEPLDGRESCIGPQGALAFPVFDVVTGNNTFRDLCFSETTAAVTVGVSPDGDGNRIERCRFENQATAPEELIVIDSAGNQIVANWFHNTAASRGTTAVTVYEVSNTLAMNVVYGSFDWAFLFNTFDGTLLLPTMVDHNSIHIVGPSGGGGIFINAAGRFCYRNNLIIGDGTSTGLSLNSVAFASQVECNSTEYVENNASLGHQSNCTCNAAPSCADCDAYCAGTSPSIDTCDITTDPGWSSSALCLPGGSTLVDAAVGTSLLYDFDDQTPALDFIGSDPDVGARESGTSRAYGGVQSTCP